MQHDPKIRYKQTNKQKCHYRTQWMTSYAPNWYIYTCIERMRFTYTYHINAFNLIQIPYTLKGKIPVGHSVVQ